MNKDSSDASKPCGLVVAFGVVFFLGLVAPSILAVSSVVLTGGAGLLFYYEFLSLAYPWNILVGENSTGLRIEVSDAALIQGFQWFAISGLFAVYTRILPIKKMFLLACATVLSTWLTTYVVLKIFDVV